MNLNSWNGAPNWNTLLYSDMTGPIVGDDPTMRIRIPAETAVIFSSVDGSIAQPGQSPGRNTGTFGRANITSGKTTTTTRPAGTVSGGTKSSSGPAPTRGVSIPTGLKPTIPRTGVSGIKTPVVSYAPPRTLTTAQIIESAGRAATAATMASGGGGGGGAQEEPATESQQQPVAESGKKNLLPFIVGGAALVAAYYFFIK